MLHGVEPGFFESLFLTSQLWENGLLDKFLEKCGAWPLDEDFYALAWDAMACVFEDFSVYGNEENEVEVLVFSDPVISEFYRLCALYQAKNPNTENRYLQSTEREVYDSLSIDAYDYDCRLYDGSHGRARLVILTWPEFYGHSELPGALAEVRRVFESATRRLRQELGLEPMKKEAA